MVLMASGTKHDPIYDSLASVIALTHALWDRRMWPQWQSASGSRSKSRRKTHSHGWLSRGLSVQR